MGTYTIALFVAAAAIVIGRFRSVPWTFAGGLCLGIAVNIIVRYVDIREIPQLDRAAPFVVLLAGLVFLARSRERVAGWVTAEAARPDWRSDLTPVQRLKVPAMASIAFLALAYFCFDDHWTAVTLRSLAVGMILLSLTVITRLGGLVTLAQAAFASVATLMTGLLVDRYDWNFYLAAVVGIVAAVLLGQLVALPSLRLGGLSFALATLALALMGHSILLGSDYMTNTGLGWLVERPTLFGLGLDDDRTLLLVIAALFALLTWMVCNLRRSATGRTPLAVRATNAAASSIGLSGPAARVRLFAVSSAMAGLGGVLLLLVDQGASGTTTPPLIAATWLTVVVVLGITRPGAAVLGGLALVLLPALMDGGFTAPFGLFSWEGLSSTQVPAILSGLAAIDLARNPDGLIERASRYWYLRRHQGRQ